MAFLPLRHHGPPEGPEFQLAQRRRNGKAGPLEDAAPSLEFLRRDTLGKIEAAAGAAWLGARVIVGIIFPLLARHRSPPFSPKLITPPRFNLSSFRKTAECIEVGFRQFVMLGNSRLASLREPHLGEDSSLSFLS